MLRTLLRILGIYKLYEKWLWRQIKNGEMPSHVGVILDGNRRWARRRGLPPWSGHEIGAKRVEELLRWCIEAGIKTLTIYVFSTENFQRTKEEVEAIMNLAKKYIRKAIESRDIHEHKVRVKAIGRLELLPKDLQEAIRKLERITENYDDHYLNIAIAYGGRSEIVDAVRRIAEKVKKGKLDVNEITEETFEKFLYTSHLPNPHPDLIIRTSGEERLSGFLLWQSAYSELVFLDVYWPDFRKIDFWRAIRIYQKRERRYGR
ncbi:MAG: di-trans,poly-cis-decaprenylcistransferase [Candidatus Methanomethylicota archaeon]|uniref:Tritrans,polycis-undecaprenyl-diphosphate synthase (geranylgeranyl-diphosphate specific) n=1 Tax=Thermoproteota archaeon TaxID=2056631 RepID=A0A497EWR8_9CREN|nr:MAG: di-trans,poly-cis-decaprenylcistransferase [Candidatus Verstraetearchaeota archaeon]